MDHELSLQIQKCSALESEINRLTKALDMINHISSHQMTFDPVCCCCNKVLFPFWNGVNIELKCLDCGHAQNYVPTQAEDYDVGC